jgi:hypothetical protein
MSSGFSRPMATEEEIIQFVCEQTGCRKSIEVTAELERDLGVYGDDISDLLEIYSKLFGVDMKNYRWYFYTGEVGNTCFK